MFTKNTEHYSIVNTTLLLLPKFTLHASEPILVKQKIS